MDEITLLGLAIPTTLATVLSSLTGWLFNHRAAKDLKGLESKMRRNEETHRLLQSPRITNALKLWSSYCEFERCVHAAIRPIGQGVSHLEQGSGEQDGARRKYEEQVERQHQAVEAASRALTGVRAEAECLMDERTFAVFDALYKACDAAFTEVYVGHLMGDPRELTEASRRAVEKMDQVKAERATVVAAMRILISPAVL
jgi:hypothetical protein